MHTNLAKVKQPLTPRALEREAKLRRHEIKKRIDELHQFITLHGGKRHYVVDLRRWRCELIDLYAQL